MREILFKAKRIDNGEWVEGSYVYRPKEVGDYRVSHYILVHDDYGFNWREIDIDTLCQYTGLTDKNGNKIWEGDVVMCIDYNSCASFLAVVEFGNPNSFYSWGYQLRHIKGDEPNLDILLWVDVEETGATCEVIGNIFDNPELLEGGE